MSRRLRVATILTAVMALALSAGAGAVAAPPRAVDVIVVLHDGVDAQKAAREMARSYDARVGHVYEHALAGFAAEVPEDRLRGLERDRRVAFVSENRVVQALEYPTGVTRIDADLVHGSIASPDITGGGVRVAIIDTGIDLDHPDLERNLDLGSDRDCVNNDDVADDDQGHGTHVAGTVAAEHNGSQVVGVAPDATLVAVKVLDRNGSGTWAQVICGVDWVTGLNQDTNGNNDVQLANMSLGGSGTHDGRSCADVTGSEDALFVAICEAIDSGTAFTVAAGNDSRDAAGFVPAAYPDVITVSAFSDTDGEANGTTTCSGGGPWRTCDEAFASFSNYGDIVDVIAPGVAILSTTYDGETGSKSGTSMAAPHVAGVAALALQQFPGLSPAQLVAHLQDTGQCPDGSVNVGTGYCQDQGTWDSDPDSPETEPMVNAHWAATTTPGGGSSTNTAPVAEDDTATTDEEVAVTVDVLANDSDADGDALTVSLVGDPANGSATANVDDTLTYTPDTDFFGEDSFAYTVSDGNGGSDSATVIVTVTNVADAPVANDDTASTLVDTAVTIDVLANDTDPDGDTLTVTSLEEPTHGSATLNGDGSVTYAPDTEFEGEDSFSYTISDGNGDSDTATVTVTVSDTVTVHVGDLDAVSINNGSTWTARVTVRIVDSDGNAVEGATVDGSWSDGASGSGSCTTDANGWCTNTIEQSGIRKNIGSVRFTIDSVTGAVTYDSSLNTDPDGDSDGTSIVVSKT